MLFNSKIFVAFMAVVLVVYYQLPDRAKILFLLALSYFFYGFWDPWLLSLPTNLDQMIGSLMSFTNSFCKTGTRSTQPGGTSLPGLPPETSNPLTHPVRHFRQRYQLRSQLRPQLRPQRRPQLRPQRPLQPSSRPHHLRRPIT